MVRLAAFLLSNLARFNDCPSCNESFDLPQNTSNSLFADFLNYPDYPSDEPSGVSGSGFPGI